MNISTEHKETKHNSYWENLTEGSTGQYKEAVIDGLLEKHFKRTGISILDIGVGTCELFLKYKEMLKAKRCVGTDYDQKIVNQMKTIHADKDIEWIVCDIFDEKQNNGTFDLIFFLDMLHEVYSFYGRPTSDVNTPIDSEKGKEFVYQALKNTDKMLNPGGGIVITDNIVTSINNQVTLRLKSDSISTLIQTFFTEYPSKKFQYELENDILKINSQDLCTLLTQYNKLKQDDLIRWNTEKFEIHQYFTREEYKNFFTEMGYTIHMVVETPKDSYTEWMNDFEIIDGLDHFPEKRVTLLAIKGH